MYILEHFSGTYTKRLLIWKHIINSMNISIVKGLSSEDMFKLSDIGEI